MYIIPTAKDQPEKVQCIVEQNHETNPSIELNGMIIIPQEEVK
jgi:hypothetical protein